MAWITKDSATARVDRRDEPYLTDAMKTELRSKILPRYEVRKGALLPALHMIQHEYGWVPEQAMLEIAQELGITPSEVQDTATFYEEYWTEQKGKTVVAVCRSIACEFCGHAEITKAACEKLGVEVGETTDDEKFTVVELECLGSCGTAPVALVGETLHENVTPDGIRRAIDEVPESGSAGH